ncbi:histidine phosphatase family protein [Streptococcus catagoni]|uniref:histidine phosphatase family protein n=1 Tax=Streptococcus catagoni TaxID=2654874 RepID=UPI00140B3040|nr:histidine phosphatase family protein [Streptococcus catagoni]
MKLYFIRHGKTQWNLEGRFQGAGGDSPLLTESYQEIKVLGQSLRNITFDAVYSSDLKRAVDTTQLLVSELDQEVEVIYTEALREWNLGKLEGAKIATMKAIYPNQISAFRHNLAQFRPALFDAESIYQTTSRVKNLIQSFENKDYKHVLLVGHGANLTASIRTLLGFEPAHLRALGGLDNSSLTVLETDDCDHFECLIWNDKSYLEDSIH